MRKSQEKTLMKKLTVRVARIIEDHITSGQWTLSEICRQCQIVNARLTEIRNYGRYKKSISPLVLKKLITGGLVLVDELKNTQGLTVEDREHIEYYFRMYEDRNLERVIQEAIHRGYNPARIISDYMRQKGEPSKG